MEFFFFFQENYIEILARSLSVTVEKNVNLFLHLATLMWILIEDCNYAKVNYFFLEKFTEKKILTE